MPLDTFTGFNAANQAAISTSESPTYLNKYVHVEWIEDNFYQLNVTDYYLGDTDIATCWRNGEQVLSDREIVDHLDMDTNVYDELHWSDDDSI